MKKTLILLLSIISYQSFSQINSIVSNHFWGGNGLDAYTNSILLDNQNIVSVCGSPTNSVNGNKDSLGHGMSDTWIINYTENYVKNWEQVLGGDQAETSMQISKINNDFIATMTSDSEPSGKRTTNRKGLRDALVYKLDENGNIVWEKSYGTNSATGIYSSTIDANGNLYFACVSQSDIDLDKTENSYGYADYWIIKTDPNGNILWDKTVGGDSTDFPHKIVYFDNHIYTLGRSLSSTSGLKSEDLIGDQDAWLVKMDLNGNVIWDKTLGGLGFEIGTDLVIHNNSIYLNIMSDSDVSGNKTDPSNGQTDMWLVKLDLDGNILFDKSIGGSGSDPGNGIEIINGDIILMNHSDSPVSGDKTEPDINNDGIGDGWVVCLDASNGNVKWDKTIGGNEGDYIKDILELSNGNYMLIGQSNSTAGGNLLSYTNGNEDIWCTTVDATLSIQEYFNQNDISLYPNPANDQTTLTIDSESNESILVSVVNLDGKVVYTTKVASNNGSTQLVLSTKNFAHGIYNVKIEQGQSLTVRKLVVQ
jgi:hypothetical protein